MIDFVVYIILFFAFLQLLVALVNFFFKERLPVRDAKTPLPSLSVLVPARNEEKNMRQLLGDLTAISDRILEIIVYDDQSVDDTAAIVEEFATCDQRIRLISGDALPDDWSGKNHACYRLSQEASGEYFLFLDADVRVWEGVIDRSLQYTKRRHCDLMSIFPIQEMLSMGEKITVPNMQIILLTLLPLPLVRLSGFPSLAAANGQFMLFCGDAYRALDPHSQFRKSRAEDIEISRYLKQQRKRVSCLTGIRDIRCRMYHSREEAVEGFSKNVTHFFGNSLVATISYWLVTTLGFVVFLAAGRIDLLWLWFAFTLLARAAALLTAGMNVGSNLLLCLPQQGMLGAFILRSMVNKQKKTFRWKGRTL
ncbi:MAG: glycosyltransferase [Bacteroidia bacterium]|jgi:glycosyltransferase involved in cell wall biosynthesis|nr:glycosyltransferase [Bacteroidia bacterium]